MTSLVDLPEEILIIIIKLLDIKSVYNLYKTCGMLKNIILMHGVIRICKLSCNALATSESLQLDMIKQISGHLHELNMSGVELKRSMLLSALKGMKNLKTLDVSFTTISIVDMLELYPACPTIRNIAIHFNLFDYAFIPQKVLYRCEELLKKFDNVHFTLDTTIPPLLFYLLRQSSLDTLKFTVCVTGMGELNLDELNIVRFRELFICMVNNTHYNLNRGNWIEVVQTSRLSNVEYIIIENNVTYTVSTSPMFTQFFVDNFKVTPCVDPDKKNFSGTTAVLIWDKKTIFDELFYFNLKKRIKDIWVCKLHVSNEQTIPLDVDTSCYDLFHIRLEVNKNERANTEPAFKKPRIANSDLVLDYDKVFEKHEKIKLNIHVLSSVNVTLSSNSEYLRKITYLSLEGEWVRYSNEFFNVLFRCCEQLVTLNVESSFLSPCWSSITRSIPLTQTLKNIRLVDKRIDFKTLFASFSQCKTLESICVIDKSTEFNELSDIAPLVQCRNLYNLHIYAEATKCTAIKMKSMVKSFQKQCNHYYNFNFNLDAEGPARKLDFHPFYNIVNH